MHTVSERRWLIALALFAMDWLDGKKLFKNEN